MKRAPEGAARLAWMLREAAKQRAAEPTVTYKARRLARHPWITPKEAAIELDVTQARISQLITAGIITARRIPGDKVKKEVRAADVFNYQTHPHKKTRTKTA